MPPSSRTRDIDDCTPARRPRPRKRARQICEDDSSGDSDGGDLWMNPSDPDEEPTTIPFTPQRAPGFQLTRHQNWTPFFLFSLFFLNLALMLLLQIPINLQINLKLINLIFVGFSSLQRSSFHSLES